MSCTYPSDGNFSSLTNDCIDTLIKERIDFYNTNDNKFTGLTGVSDAEVNKGISFASQIPLIVNALQRIVLSNPATTLQETIEADTTLDIEIMQTKEDLKIAEQRVKSLRNPNKKSYYESWFPLNRPLRTSTNITLIGLGIFFFTFSLLIGLSSIGFSFRLNAAWAPNSPTISKLGVLFPFGYGTTFTIIGLIIGICVVYLRNA
jgi:hypothetical protein